MFEVSSLRETRYYQEVEAELRITLRDEIKAQIEAECQDEISAEVLARISVEREARERRKIEAKLEIVPRLLALGLTLQQIAQALDLDDAFILSTLRFSTQGPS
jgi:predicted transposase/invertase (TIGR01784 family)